MYRARHNIRFNVKLAQGMMFDWFGTVNFTRYPINSNTVGMVGTGCTSCSRFPSYAGKDAEHLEQTHSTKAIARM